MSKDRLEGNWVNHSSESAHLHMFVHLPSSVGMSPAIPAPSKSRETIGCERVLKRVLRRVFCNEVSPVYALTQKVQAPKLCWKPPAKVIQASHQGH